MTNRTADLLICELATGRVVDRVHLSSISESFVDRVVGGMLINFDTERYYIDESEVEAARRNAESGRVEQ